MFPGRYCFSSFVCETNTYVYVILGDESQNMTIEERVTLLEFQVCC